MNALKQLKIEPRISLFVGDGGSNELFGAKQVGMKTVFSECLDIKSEEKRKVIKHKNRP